MTSRAGRPRRDRSEALRRLAAAWGIETSYRDNAGVDRPASPETLSAVLEAMGAPIAGEWDAEEALSATVAQQAGQACDPVVIAWRGRLPVIPLRAAGARPGAVCAASIELEESGTIAVTGHVVTASGPGSAGARDQAQGEEAGVAIALELREALPFGVHRMSLDLGDAAPAVVQVLAAPIRCWEGERDGRERHQRRLGLFAPVHALRSSRSAGAQPGDLSDLARLRDWALPLGVDAIGVLPLLATFLDQPYDPSPYAPVSRLFWNEVFLDPAASPDLERSPEAASLLESSSSLLAPAPPQAGQPIRVDYRASMTAKRRVLEALARAAFSSPARRREIEAFLGAEPHLEDYARFRATAERERAGWPAWPEAQRAGRLEAADFDDESRRYHVYAQWLWDRQFRALFGAGEALYLDLPIGVHGGGFDVWRFRDRFALGASVGAPPDLFFAAGQDWGFPPPHPLNGRAGGHAYFRSVVRAQLRRAGMLRLDHVMALHRLFWIPRGAAARDGVYVRYPSEELYAVLAIESHRHRARIVGENLGTVPPEVNEGLRRHGLLPMRILQFDQASDWRRQPPEIEGLAALNTHDTATFAAFWEGHDIGLRVRLGLLDHDGAAVEGASRDQIRSAVVAALRAEGWLDREAAGTAGVQTADVLRALLRRLAASDAAVLIVQLEDLWLEREPQNVPGIAGEYPSWRRRMQRSLGSLAGDAAIASLLRELAAVRHEVSV
jgi:4-alpha-glucanotransferase